MRNHDVNKQATQNGHKDWTHAEPGAPVLKAQHPDFERYNQGIHARSGVSCSDCHMPYNVNRACQTCHNWTEAELTQRVTTIQDRTFELRNRAMDAMVAWIGDMKTAMELQRRAQFMVDFVEAENSKGHPEPLRPGPPGATTPLPPRGRVSDAPG